jgi:biotin synthase
MNNIKSNTNIATCNDSNIRHDWSRQEILALYNTPLNDLLFEAHTLHRQYFDPNTIQLSTLLNIKSGGCSEDCAYCSQSARHKSAVEAETMMPVFEAVKMAKQAKENGASRFCMGAAWRQPNDQDLGEVINMVHEIKALGLETCATLGMLTWEQALKLKKAGLDYYNHNLDTSAAFYKSIISTHDYEDRLHTLGYVRDAGINVCCGGIIGMGESEHDRADMLQTLACMPKHPESVPINLLIKVEGTPLSDVDLPDTFEFIRMIAVARILMPASFVRLSAGR